MTEQMTIEESAVWIGERLFDRVFKKVKIEGLQSLVDDRQYRYVTPATNKEIAYFLCGSDDLLDLETFIKWLSSPDGIFAVKARMIEKGYQWEIHYLKEFMGLPNQYYATFSFGCKSWSGWKDSEAEAVLAACEKALRAEI